MFLFIQNSVRESQKNYVGCWCSQSSFVFSLNRFKRRSWPAHNQRTRDGSPRKICLPTINDALQWCVHMEVRTKGFILVIFASSLKLFYNYSYIERTWRSIQLWWHAVRKNFQACCLCELLQPQIYFWGIYKVYFFGLLNF